MPISNPTPEVSGRYGAPLGRYTGPDYLEAAAGRVYLRRVYLDNGGYDSGGAYWGHGQPLFYAEDGDGNSQFLRAYDRDAAKAKLLAKFPDLKFWR